LYENIKIRTLLTLTGVLIGTTSIAVMMSIGVGMDRAFESQFSRMGSLNTITVTGYYYSDGGSDYYYSVSGGTGNQKRLDDKAVRDFEQIEGVEAVMPQLRAYLKFVSGRYVAGVNVVGVDPSKMRIFGFEVK